MNSSNSHANFQRGVASIVILSLLKREDMYGYQLVQETERSSNSLIITQEGSLYPVLYKLLDQGYISDYRVQAGKRMTRIYYHLEPAGAEYLQALIRDYKAVHQGVMHIIHGTGGDSHDSQ